MRFETWYKSHKDSIVLKDQYKDYKSEFEENQESGKPIPFKQWMRNYYIWLDQNLLID